MIATSPDGQWAAVRRGREVALLAGGAGPATARIELPTEDADLIIVGPPSVVVVVTRGAEADGTSANRLVLYQPPFLDAVARLDLDVPMRIAAITGPRIALVALDGKAVTIVRIAARALSSQAVDTGSPVEFAVGLDRNQILFGLLRKLEAWDAVSGRPLLRMQIQLPPPPRIVGPAHGHLWAMRPRAADIIVCRMSDGRPFRHLIGAPIDEVVCHPSSPLLILVTARGLVRLHCFAHSLTVIDAPWQPGMPLGQLVVGEDISLLGLPEPGSGDAADDEPWRVPIGGAGAPAITLESSDAPSEPPLTTAADKLRAMRERTLPALGDSEPRAAPASPPLASPPDDRAGAARSDLYGERDPAAATYPARSEARDDRRPTTRPDTQAEREPAATTYPARAEREPAAATYPARSGAQAERDPAAATYPARAERDAAAATYPARSSAQAERDPAAATYPAQVERDPAAATYPAQAERDPAAATYPARPGAQAERDPAAATYPARSEARANVRPGSQAEREPAATYPARADARTEREPAAATYPAPSRPGPRGIDAGRSKAWREVLAAFGAELGDAASGEADAEVPAVASDSNLGQLAHRLALPAAARRALVVLYSRYLIGAPGLSIARLARVVGDWSEPLGQGELAALAMLRRRAGMVTLRGAVTDALDGVAPRAIRVVGTGARAKPGAWQLERAGRSDAELEAHLAAQLGLIGVIGVSAVTEGLGGSVATGVLEAQLRGATAVALAAPPARPLPWPRDAALVVVAEPGAPAWVAALPSLTA